MHPLFRPVLLAIAAVALTAVWAGAWSPDGGATAQKELEPAGFELSTRCPPSFEKRADRCYLVTRYQFYDSIEGRGVGGTQTSLPPHRDGFSPEQIDLGRLLFFDPLLSADNSLSCATCHQPDRGFSDGRARSVGIDGQTVRRSAPSLWNVAFLDRFFWDARAETLEEQALGPLFDPREMGASPEQVLDDLRDNAYYPALFRHAFPESDDIGMAQVARALAAFQTSLISLNSRYDRYAHGHHAALSSEEIAGLNVFRSFVARCAECHQPPLFTNNQIAVIGVPAPDGEPLDPGAQETFNAPKLRGGFKVPTLRNISQTAPYMHRGNFETMQEVVSFYNKGRGHAVPEDENLYLHWHIWEPNLSDREIELIVAFLDTLTDESLMPSIPRAVPSGLDPIAALEGAEDNQATGVEKK
ncbi:MAG TPA: cytochrome c peroxidase [Wenzhouxiangella sp.]|nr:cytochrome c peroxidase [Wenzhouxiangella sp.]